MRSQSHPLWRSLLYVPANVERYVESALRSEADAIQLDLEDGISESEKAAARRLVPAVADKIAGSGADVIVRINRPLSLAIRDIETCVGQNVSALSLPKVDSSDHVRLLSEAVSEAEAQAGQEVGTTRFIVGIESPEAWFRMPEIAAADARVAAILLGSEDFVTAVGMSADPEFLIGPKQALVVAAASASVLPLGLVGSFANYKDLKGLRELARRSRKMGYKGSSCIHPSQAPILNEEFGPKPDEVAVAREVIANFEAAREKGLGAVGVGGKMIDLPVVERARTILAWQARIEERCAR